MLNNISILPMLALMGFLIWFCIVLPAQMATRRNRSGLLWVLIALVGSPLLAILLLVALGDADNK